LNKNYVNLGRPIYSISEWKMSWIYKKVFGKRISRWRRMLFMGTWWC